jgi:cytochrome c5
MLGRIVTATSFTSTSASSASSAAAAAAAAASALNLLLAAAAASTDIPGNLDHTSSCRSCNANKLKFSTSFLLSRRPRRTMV